ncbi:unnamed protein product [Rotaria sp. Silwood1]|nr:unnamed protein product [Rotaria sp. Silwood1]
MTATTTTTIVNLPKNKTGLFAGDTIQEVKSLKSQPIIMSRQSRHTNSTNQLSIPSEQRKISKIQQYYRIDRINALKNDTTNNLLLSKNILRTGFRPSPIRHQKLHETNSSSSKQPFSPSHTSTKLKSEIDHLNNKLKLHGDLNKLLRTQQNRDTIATPRSALSYSTSYRISSASTNYIVDIGHQRYPSAITNNTINTIISNSGTIDILSKSTQSLSGITESSPTINEEDNNTNNHQITHAYQIPQQSNVGNESIFPLNSLPPPSSSSLSSLSNRKYSKRKDHRSKGTKSASCPFYVMYFTNLATQQQQQPSTNNENDKISLSISATPIRKGTINSRTSTSYSRRQSIRRHVNSPISLNTYSTIDDDDDVDNQTTNTTSYYNNKRFSARIAAFENENSHLLKDILRTTSWNHVQV